MDNHTQTDTGVEIDSKCGYAKWYTDSEEKYLYCTILSFNLVYVWN